MEDYKLISHINELMKKSTTGQFIYDKLNGNTNLIVYGDLNECKHIDDLFIDDSCVILLETKEDFGHWVCIIKHPNSIEAFNSYGNYIDDDLKYVPKNMKKRLGEDYPTLSLLLYDSGYKIEYNDYKLQSKSSSIATCGYHVIMRIKFKEMNIDDYAKMLLNKEYTPDQLVVMYVLSI